MHHLGNFSFWPWGLPSTCFPTAELSSMPSPLLAMLLIIVVIVIVRSSLPECYILESDISSEFGQSPSQSSEVVAGAMFSSGFEDAG